MQVHVRLREDFERNAEGAGAGAQQTPGGLRRFLHHIAELARERDLALARHADRLDEHDVTADRRPRQSRRHTELGRSTGNFTLHLRLAGVFLEILDRDLHGRRLPFDDLERGLPQHALNLALELAHTGLARVLADQALQCGVGQMRALLFPAESRFLELPRQ